MHSKYVMFAPFFPRNGAQLETKRPRKYVSIKLSVLTHAFSMISAQNVFVVNNQAVNARTTWRSTGMLMCEENSTTALQP